MRREGLALLALVACASAPAAPALPPGPVALRLEDVSGRVFTLGELRGKVVLLHFFATWAGPSVAEVPRLNALARRFGERLAVVGVAPDSPVEAVDVFVEGFAVRYPVWVPAPSAALGQSPIGPVTTYPTSFLFDPDGRMVARMEGFWGPDVLEAAVERLLAGSGSGR